MDVGFHHERIRPRCLGGLGVELVPRIHDQMTDLLDSFGPEKAHVIANASPTEAGLFFPITDPHDVPQSAMLFCEIVQLVVVQIAARPHSSQDQNLPIVHPFPSTVISRIGIDILSNQLENGITQLGLAVDVLQGRQDGNDLVSTFQV